MFAMTDVASSVLLLISNGGLSSWKVGDENIEVISSRVLWS